jgi:hydrogenase-4 component F
LVGFEDTRQALEAAWKYIVLMFMGAAIALLGFLMLFEAAQQAGGDVFTWAGLRAIAPRLPPVLTETAFLFVLIGFGTKSGFVPMHTWLPDAHSQAPSPVCALLSGVKTTTVLYVILRFLPLINPPQRNGWPLLFGLVSIAVAAFLILGVRDYKRMFAFSTVEHMGIIFTAIGFGVPAASAAAMAQIVTHSVTKSFCFLAAGSARLAVQTRDIASVRGLAWSSPVSASALLLGGLAIGGAPPFAVFLSEFSIFRAGYGQGAYVITTVLVILIVVAFFGMLYHVTHMVFGRPVKPRLERRALPVSCRASLLLAAVPVVLLGVYLPYPLHQLLGLAAATLER